MVEQEPDAVVDGELRALRDRGKRIYFHAAPTTRSPTGCTTSRCPPAARGSGRVPGSLAVDARLAGWDIANFESTWCLTPDQLQRLRTSAAADLGRTDDGMPYVRRGRTLPSRARVSVGLSVSLVWRRAQASTLIFAHVE
jgi:hypothetical protein